MEVSGVSASVESAVSSVSNSDPVELKVQVKAVEQDKQTAETRTEPAPDPSSKVGQNVDVTV